MTPQTAEQMITALTASIAQLQTKRLEAMLADMRENHPDVCAFLVDPKSPHNVWARGQS